MSTSVCILPVSSHWILPIILWGICYYPLLSTPESSEWLSLWFLLKGIPNLTSPKCSSCLSPSSWPWGMCTVIFPNLETPPPPTPCSSHGGIRPDTSPSQPFIHPLNKSYRYHPHNSFQILSLLPTTAIPIQLPVSFCLEYSSGVLTGLPADVALYSCQSDFFQNVN